MVRVADLPDLGAVTDASRLVGDTSGSGTHTTPALRSYLAGFATLCDVKAFGAKGDGTTDDSAFFTAACTAKTYGLMPTGSYKLTAGVTLPFADALIAMPGATIASGGAGLTQAGPTVRFADNPSGQTAWTASVPYSYSGIAVDFGGYGPTQFGTTGNPTGITGKMVVPATASTAILNGFGLAGYVKNSATVTNGVAVFGEAHARAANAKVWGANTVTDDDGFATAVWGIEVDVNLTNASSQVIGVDVTGASTVEPAISPAFRVGPLGEFTTPFKRWSHGLQVSDGSAVTGIEIGTAISGATSGSMPVTFAYNNSTPVRGYAAEIAADSGGNLLIELLDHTPGLYLTTPNAGGVQQQQIVLQNGGLGFFSTSPVGKQTVTGSKGGNAALGSLITALATMGLITDTTT